MHIDMSGFLEKLKLSGAIAVLESRQVVLVLFVVVAMLLLWLLSPFAVSSAIGVGLLGAAVAGGVFIMQQVKLDATEKIGRRNRSFWMATTAFATVFLHSPILAKWEVNRSGVAGNSLANAVATSSSVPSLQNPLLEARFEIFCEGAFNPQYPSEPFVIVKFNVSFPSHNSPIPIPSSASLSWDGNSRTIHSVDIISSEKNIFFASSETDEVISLLKQSSVVALQTTDLFGEKDIFEWKLSGSSSAINAAFSHCGIK